jgi:hypothetical protein
MCAIKSVNPSKLPGHNLISFTDLDQPRSPNRLEVIMTPPL